jgi:serine/threonine-protein kinase RIO1
MHCTLCPRQEFKNLTRIHRAGLACPTPIDVLENVLAMSLVGHDGVAAPQLREVVGRVSQGLQLALLRQVRLGHAL